MKKLNFILAFLLMTPIAFAQKVTLSGSIRTNDTTLLLTHEIKGTSIKIPVRKDKSFIATFNIPGKGIYSLSSIADLYLVPGNNIRITPADSSGYEFSGPGSLENTIISNLHKERKILPIGGDLGIRYSTLNDKPSNFLNLLDIFQQNIAAKVSKSKDTFFVKIMNGLIRHSAQSLLSTYREYYGFDSLVMQRITKPKKPGYYKTSGDQMKLLQYQAVTLRANFLSKEDIVALDAAYNKDFSWNDEQLFYQARSYRDQLIHKLSKIPKNQYGQKLAPDAEAVAVLKIVDEKIQSDLIKSFVKGNFGLSYLNSGKDAHRVDSIYKMLQQLRLAPYIKEQIDVQYKNYAKLKLDPSSLDFAYKTVDDKVITLKSLRGKYVYIDLWATWCMPCKAEIPALQKLEKEFHGKNIHFVSISVDKLKDKQTWINYVKEQQLTGIQIMADKDFSSDFIQAFQVTSIPRFILLAPDGKIISANADRPSNPALSVQLLELLSK